MSLSPRKLLVISFVALASACGGKSTEMVSLMVVRTGTASGTVTSIPAGIDCGASCGAALPLGTTVVLTAAPAAGAAFTGWSGACSGAALTCSFALPADTAVGATFDVARHPIDVVLAGNGGGSVASTPPAISCPGTCAATLDHGTTLTFEATPQAGSIFLGWSGACTGTGPCTITVTSPATLTAAFGLEQSLVVTRSGNGSGTAAGGGGLIDCGPTCSVLFPPGATVMLTAMPATGSTFTGWSGGGCAGTGACTVVMDAATTVDAAFTLDRHALDVTRAGSGAGTVSSAPAGISCGATCTADFDYGTSVTLTATPATGSSFTGWSGGGCGGTGSCTVAVAAVTTVTATFTLSQYAVAVALAGAGSGAVTSAPAGIDCGATCAAAYDHGTTVTLTATPATGSAFIGWTGGCTGIGPCTVAVTAATSITATFNLLQHPVTVALAGTGTGTVTTAPAGINCGATCTADFDHGTSVTLIGTPAAGSTFTGWSGGGCFGTGTCTVPVTAATSVTATFALNQYVIIVAKAGAGSGAVTSAPSGIGCGTTCAATFDYGTSVTLTAAPAVGSTFTGWSGGGCAGTGTCTVAVTAAASVTATFALLQYPLTVVRAGTGGGTVTSAQGGISCGATCTAAFDYGSTVTLTAVPAIGSTFAGWSGAGCAGTGTCAVPVTAGTLVTATFALLQYPLTVTLAGNGTVTSAPAGINCGTSCSAAYDYGTAVTLTATPATGSIFTGWTGACTGTGSCTVSVIGARAVTASFTAIQYPLTVARAGAGSGNVTSAPAGISCGATCSALFDYGTTVTLTATPNGGSDFAGWTGACSGTGACTINIDMARSVTASFTVAPIPLTVAKSGSGGGTVTSGPAGISCGAICTAAWASGTMVTLSAAPDASSTFAGWSGGACTGTGDCSVTLTVALTVTANFTATQYPLTVTRAGTGSGSVTSMPAGIVCGLNCSAIYASGASVTLIAAPDASSNFAGWSGGGCSGTGSCTVSMSSALTVTATFNITQFTLNVTRSGAGGATSSVDSTPAGISCGATCSAAFNAGTIVTLTATAGAGATFAGWSGACTGTGACTLTMASFRSVNATFN